MAVATSEASARVGVGAWIIDSSICVATMHGLPAWRQARTMRRWIGGTCSAGISTPRSPRATMTASDSATMASRCSMADGFSSLAMTPARPATMPRISSSPPDAARRTARSSRRQARARRPGRAGPWASAPRAAARRRHVHALAVGQRARRRPRASRRSRGRRTRPAAGPCRRRAEADAGLERREDLRMRQADALLVAGRRVEIEPERCARGQRHGPSAKVPRRSFGPCRSARTPIGRPDSRSIARIRS